MEEVMRPVSCTVAGAHAHEVVECAIISHSKD